jgi:hypothetical protein
MYKSDHLGVWLTVDWFALWHQRSLNEWKIFAIPLMLFLGSLLAPAVMLTGYARPPVEEWEPGWVMFLYGPLGLLDGQVGWFANPLMLAAVLLGKHKRAATILASLAIFLATSVTSITFNTVPAKVSHLVVIRFGLGYYLWLASSISLLVVMRLSFRTISGVSDSPEGAESK